MLSLKKYSIDCLPLKTFKKDLKHSNYYLVYVNLLVLLLAGKLFWFYDNQVKIDWKFFLNTLTKTMVIIFF